MNDQPHSSWAEVYDIACQHSFGDFYARMTDATIDMIVNSVPPPASIVDFGAGTGRLSIPLSRNGYAVTAVDSCGQMLCELKRKDIPDTVETVCSKMEDFRAEGQFDAALCLFTVILYLLDENALTKSFAAAHASLKPRGILILDVPSEAIFQGYSRNDSAIKCIVTITHLHNGIYTYNEDLHVKSDDGDIVHYQDQFLIRHWSFEQVRNIWKNTGFDILEDVSESFIGTGSNYYILQKAE